MLLSVLMMIMIAKMRMRDRSDLVCWIIISSHSLTLSQTHTHTHTPRQATPRSAKVSILKYVKHTVYVTHITDAHICHTHITHILIWHSSEASGVSLSKESRESWRRSCAAWKKIKTSSGLEGGGGVCVVILNLNLLTCIFVQKRKVYSDEEYEVY